jgi:sugar lactone lactonase YvrE
LTIITGFSTAVISAPAEFRINQVRRRRLSGERIATHPLPALCPTMPAFGGPDLRTVYVTSARQQRDAEELARLPRSGGIFAMRVDVAGLPEPLFGD